MSARKQAPVIEGEVLWRDDPGYEHAWAGALWNRVKPRRYPEVIVRAASERDVPAAVDLARARGMRIAMRAGGHSWCGSPLRDGGMLLDLSQLRRWDIDAASATATVQPGVIGSELATELTRRELAFPAGHCATVALGGYLLSGGLGWNSGLWGPACASVEEIEAVTAVGETVRCNPDEHPDLFWAARGAGPGFFAAVTAFRLRLYPRPSSVASTKYVLPMADTAAAVRWAVDAAHRLPPNVELSFFLGTADPPLASGRPAPKAVTISATAFSDTGREAAAALEPLRDCPFASRALSRQIAEPTPLDTLYGAASDAWPAEHRYAADTLWSDAPYETLLTELAGVIEAAPSDKALVLAPVAPVGRKRELTADMAFSALGESYVVPYAVWDDPAEDEANISWLRETMRAIEPLGTGHYIAETDLSADPSRARRSYTAEDWERLQKVRAGYDPQGVFHSYLTPDA
ncbi:FAD-binding oxidoreductase [Streptomyces sp. NPDC051776]|uniref:FAD-binding oxidoreductase n=1 Tax=Streptomyces sp. NPDC051776 TaxID=3155414 RepID=UPI00342F1835